MTHDRASTAAADGIEYDRRDRHGVLRVFGREVLAGSPRARDAWLDRACEYWRRRGFPFPRVTRRDLEREFGRLLAVPPGTIVRGNALAPSMVGLRIANAFHPQMWRVKVHGVSAVERFQDDGVLREALLKALRFWPDRRCWNAQCVRSMMRIHHRTRIANFRPTVAKALITHYSTSGSHVFDFSAGFGGRLLGALALDRHYIAVDPARSQVRGLRRMVKATRRVCRGTAEVHQTCAEVLMPTLPSHSVDLVFSSPPYFDLERYSTERTQSYIRYPTYDRWRDQFLSVVIREAHRMLRRGGFLVLNVSNTHRCPVASDAYRQAAKRFRVIRRFRLLMNAPPTDRARGCLYRWEPVFVFQKR